MLKQLLLISLGFIVTFSITPSSLKAQQLEAMDVKLMRQRIRELKSVNPPSVDSVQKLVKFMQADGSWESIEYNNTRVSHWPPYTHLTDYVMPMAKAYANSDSPRYQDKKLAKNIHTALDYWLDHNFVSLNWWHHDIGIPKTLGNILILMDQEVTPTELLQALNQMRGSYIAQTGQNKVWRAEIQLKIGLLEFGKGRTNLLGSPANRIEKASTVLRAEVVVQGKEGIQPDWSFYQHGVQQQFGNYGLSFADSQAKWVYVLKDTPYEYSEQKIKILREYLLKGLSRVIWKETMDISGIGRQIFPDSPSKKRDAVIHVLQIMSKADSENAPMYQQVINYNLGKAGAPSFQKQNKYFWRSALMVNQSENNHISVRMSSKIIQSTESGNGENLLGAHLSDGATYLYKTGKEYKNIFPVWNWHRIPGVTSYAKGSLPEVDWRGLHNESDFVGGVSDSTYGAVTMLFKRNDLSAHKSWFFTSDGMVCLGAGINSSREKNVFTTLNQSLINGKVVVKNNKRREILEQGQSVNSSDIDWVYHNKTGYLFLEKGRVHVGSSTQQGNWHRVYDNESEKEVSQNVFNLWVDHGSKPQNSSYAYMILPNVSQNKMTDFVSDSSVTVLQNTSSLQAVQNKEKKLTQMIFYEPGNVELNKSITISTDTPCLLMVQQMDEKLKITISAPPELQKYVKLTISGHYRGQRCTYNSQKNQTIVKIDLPDNMYAGQSVGRLLNTL